MKYKKRYISQHIKEWTLDPHRCSAYQLQQELGYFAAQYIGPALLRLKEKPKEDRAQLIEEESRKCKHFSAKCLHFLAHRIFDEQQNPGQIDLQCSMDLQKAQLLQLDTTDSVALKKSLLSTGYKMLELGTNIERARIESLLHTYCLIYYFHRWDGEVAERDDGLIMDEVGLALLKSRGLPAGKSTIYQSLIAFEEIAKSITAEAPPSSLLSDDFHEWFKLLIERISERSKKGADGFSDHFHLMGALPGLREYGRSADPQIEEKPAPKKLTKKTPEEIADALNAKMPQQRSAFITRTFTKIDDALNVINLLDTTELSIPTNQLSANRQSLETALNKLNDLIQHYEYIK